MIFGSKVMRSNIRLSSRFTFSRASRYGRYLFPAGLALAQKSAREPPVFRFPWQSLKKTLGEFPDLVCFQASSFSEISPNYNPVFPFNSME
jgi:hypothetical protein